MTSSSKPAIERGLDTSILVYSLLQGHPASSVCDQYLHAHAGWFVTSVTLIEAKSVLTKVYGVLPVLASQKLTQFASGPVTVIDIDAATVAAAFALADQFALDLNDATFLQAARQQGVQHVATDDHRLAQVCPQFSILAESPLDPALRQHLAAWETAHLPAKGLPRILRRVHDWLSPAHPQAAQDFWSHTGGASHLP